MIVFRIAKKQFITDLSGEGARLYGGRWNHKGISVVYTSASRSLATVEYLVHLSMTILPSDVCIAQIEVPDDLAMREVDVLTLPPEWWKYPADPTLAEIGNQWKVDNSAAVLKVPSAVVKDEWNYLLNPNHDSFSRINLLAVEEYVLDQRLLGTQRNLTSTSSGFGGIKLSGT